MAHKIVSKKQLSGDVFTAEIEAPLVAHARQPGQFVIISIDNDYSERIPLTIAELTRKKELFGLYGKESEKQPQSFPN